MKGWRRVLASFNVLTMLVLLGVLFIMVNYIASRRYSRWDLKQFKTATLSDKTRQTLKSLTQPVTVAVFYQPTNRLYDLVKDQLQEYQRYSSRIKVEYVDPDQDFARAKQLATEFQIEEANLVVFQSGTRHKYLSDTELAEYDYEAVASGGRPRVKAFKGEEAFTATILSVTQATTPLIWATTGHGEKALDSTEPKGISSLQRALEQQNFSVQPVNLLEQPTIPRDVRLIIIPGPTHRFTEVEVGLLQAYLEQGGGLLALIDPLEDTGLDDLLERWGVTLGMDIVVDPARQLPFVSAANLFVTSYTQHPIVQKMKTLMTLFPLARSVQPTKPAPQGLATATLALTSAAGWGETTTAIETFEYNDGQDLKGPVSIAVAAERTTPARTRVVAIGDSDFLINAQLPNVGNRDFLLGAVYWLTEQEQLIGIGPKPLNTVKLNLTGQQLTGVFWFSFLALPLACGMLGALMWWTRRT